MSLHDDWKESPVGQAKFVGPKIGESVKTRKVEIEIGSGNWRIEGFDKDLVISFEDLQWNKIPALPHDTQLKISFEIPDPERKIETTRQKVSESIGEWLMKNKLYKHGAFHFGDLVDEICGKEKS